MFFQILVNEGWTLIVGEPLVEVFATNLKKGKVFLKVNEKLKIERSSIR